MDLGRLWMDRRQARKERNDGLRELPFLPDEILVMVV